jgi:cytochrome c biogenesis protein CcdA
VVGFYLVNIGYVTRALRTTAALHSSRDAIELVSDKIGVVLLVLGSMHFLNFYVFNQLRKRGRPERFGAPPPPPPPGMGRVLD